MKWTMTCVLLFIFNLSRNRFIFHDSMLKSIYTSELFIDGFGKLGFKRIVVPFLAMIIIQGLVMGFAYGCILYIFNHCC